MLKQNTDQFWKPPRPNVPCVPDRNFWGQYAPRDKLSNFRDTHSPARIREGPSRINSGVRAEPTGRISVGLTGATREKIGVYPRTR